MANALEVKVPVVKISQPLLLLLAASLTFATAPASAQTVVNIKRDALEQVRFYKAPRQIQILDESPIVTDPRRQPQNAPEYAINVPPMPGSSGKAGVIMLTPQRNSLPQSGFQTQIPAGGMIKPNLPATVMGGHAPIDAPRPVQAQTARPVGIKSVHATTPGKPAVPATYSSYPGQVASSFDSRFAQHVKVDLHGSLVNHK